MRRYFNATTFVFLGLIALVVGWIGSGMVTREPIAPPERPAPAMPTVAASWSEAEEIVAAAREDAERMTSEAQTALEELVTRRTKAVEEKIAQAEAQALAEVRSRSADIAVEAARILLADQVKENGDALLEQSIKDVGSRLN